jgi:hypothetical protein
VKKESLHVVQLTDNEWRFIQAMRELTKFPYSYFDCLWYDDGLIQMLGTQSDYLFHRLQKEETYAPLLERAFQHLGKEGLIHHFKDYSETLIQIGFEFPIEEKDTLIFQRWKKRKIYRQFIYSIDIHQTLEELKQYLKEHYESEMTYSLSGSKN